MKYVKLILLIMLVNVFLTVQASHISGGEITYFNISKDKFKVVVKMYRFCRDSALKGISADVSAPGCVRQTVVMARTNIRDISQVCFGGVAPCTPQNTYGAGFGYEEHTFEGIVDFALSPYNNFKNNGCCKVYFGAGICCRSGAIMTGSAGQDFWIQAMADICLANFTNKTNNSPQFLNVPNNVACCNQPFFLSEQALDSVENDLLSYELVAGFDGKGLNSITYNKPLSSSTPISPYCTGTIPCAANPTANPPQGIYLGKDNGDFIFTPTDCNGSGVVVVQVNEYRENIYGKNELIGTIRRDFIQDVVLCGPNNNPVISPTRKTDTINPGDKICFTINATDKQFIPHQLKADTVTLSWNRGILGATFSVINPKSREKQAEFCWQTNISNQSKNLYAFTVVATDDNCPYVGRSSKSFKILVATKQFLNKQNINKSEIVFSPNPASNELNYKGIPLNSSITFYDLTGKVVLYFKNLTSHGIFEIGKLNQGIYTIEVETNHQKIRSRLVKI